MNTQLVIGTGDGGTLHGGDAAMERAVRDCHLHLPNDFRVLRCKYAAEGGERERGATIR